MDVKILWRQKVVRRQKFCLVQKTCWSASFYETQPEEIEIYDNFDEICDKNPHFNHNAAKDSILNNQKLNRPVLRVWGVQSNTAKRAWYKMNVGDYVVFNRGSEKKGSEYFQKWESLVVLRYY